VRSCPLVSHTNKFVAGANLLCLGWPWVQYGRPERHTAFKGFYSAYCHDVRSDSMGHAVNTTAALTAL
jgi:hypothetical protein